jgi:glutathione S-transferase
VEFINDLITPTGSTALLPHDPVLRAKARFIIESVCSKLVPAYFNATLRGEHPKNIVDAIEILQGFLPELQQTELDKGGLYLLGKDQWSMADAACVTVLARAEVALENDLGAYDEGEGRKEWERVMSDERFARFRRWYADVKGRKSFSETWHRVSCRLLSYVCCSRWSEIDRVAGVCFEQFGEQVSCIASEADGG